MFFLVFFGPPSVSFLNLFFDPSTCFSSGQTLLSSFPFQGDLPFFFFPHFLDFPSPSACCFSLQFTRRLVWFRRFPVTFSFPLKFLLCTNPFMVTRYRALRTFPQVLSSFFGLPFPFNSLFPKISLPSPDSCLSCLI